MTVSEYFDFLDQAEALFDARPRRRTALIGDCRM